MQQALAELAAAMPAIEDFAPLLDAIGHSFDRQRVQICELEKSRNAAKQAQAKEVRKTLRKLEEEQCLGAADFQTQHL